jgi:hypothetical protein
MPPHLALGAFFGRFELSTALLITWAVMNSYQQALFFEHLSSLFETTISGGPGAWLSHIWGVWDMWDKKVMNSYQQI